MECARMNVIRIHPSDTVAVAIEPLTAGQTVMVSDFGVLTVQENIPQGHKIALVKHSPGDKIRKYGSVIGTATAEIAPGAHVHTHNCQTTLSGTLSYRYTPDFHDLPRETPRTFSGYRRDDGKVGIRNEIWIFPTVGCVNGIVTALAAEATAKFAPRRTKIVAYTHPFGCSQLGEDAERTMELLCGLIRHPNAAGVLVVGLGCENSPIPLLQTYLGTYDPTRVRFLACQDCADEMTEGLSILETLLAKTETAVRTEIPVSDLVIGLKCGGSDGFSGITANPLVGAVSDRLISMGGSAILTEVPEMFGAETLPMARCRNEAVFQKTVDMVNGFKEYFLTHGEAVGENPSPGNKVGGITTLEEKSLGCTQKGGTAPVEDVLLYGEPIRTHGLSLLQAPGNDLVASTALAASGAQLVLFTTGRGTPFGCPVPTMKLSTNTALARKKPHWIDFDAGVLLDGIPMAALADSLLDRILAIASGVENVRSEALSRENLAIWKDGVTL